MEANDIYLNSSKPFDYKISALINETARCDLGGQVIQKPLDVNSHIVCKAFDITHYNPYIDKAANENLSKYDILLDSLLTSIDLHLVVEEKNSTLNVKLNDSQLSLDNLELKKRGSKETFVDFDHFVVDGLNFDLLSKEVGIEKVSLDRLSSSIKRYANAKINIDELVIPKSTTEKKNKTKSQKSFHLHVKEFALNNAKVEFADEMLE
ncbi:MAG: DUF748 domain-containing protein [Campylobacterales bacterium]|nr:DUF748 domain-containing protein [Campylobacterales bacterium]